MILMAAVVLALCAASCGQNAAQQQSNQRRVGVFDGYGGAQTCIWEAVSACRLDGDLKVRTITTGDIARGVLDSLDVIVIPGGGGSRQYLNLGGENVRRIQEFVRNGGGAVGICAGAYLFSDTPEYTCIGLNGAAAIDREHDNRGHGNAAFRLTEEGKRIFPEYAQADTLFCMYYEGPVLIPAENPDITYYTEFATMLSDVHEEGDAPANMTNNRPFFLGTTYGKGRVFSCIAHPEATPGKMWMIARMVRWTLGEEALPQRFSKADALKDPTLVNRECLMSIADLKKESSCLKTFFYGTEEEKLEALEWLKAHSSWDAKRWVQGLLFDESANVRAAAAEYIADIHYLTYLPDVEALYGSEPDEATREAVGRSLERLRSLLP